MKNFPILLGLAATCLPFFTASAQKSTTPVGYVSYPLPATAAPATTYLSAPLVPASMDAGTVGAVGTNTITAPEMGWTENQFAQTPHHVLITSGAEAGRTLHVLGNTATRLTVDVTDGTAQATGLDTAGFAVGAGDGFEIVADDTLGGFFGATSATMTLVGGATAEAADRVGLWSVPSETFEFYYFNTIAGHWVKEGDTARSDAAGLVLAPGAAMAIVRQPGRPAGRMVLTGMPPAVAPLLKMAGSGVLQYYGTPFPVDISLGQLDLATNWVKKHSLGKSDALYVYQAATATWHPYHERSNGVWLRGHKKNAKNGLVIPAGSVLGFLKREPVSGADSFIQILLPYVL